MYATSATSVPAPRANLPAALRCAVPQVEGLALKGGDNYTLWPLWMWIFCVFWCALSFSLIAVPCGGSALLGEVGGSNPCLQIVQFSLLKAPHTPCHRLCCPRSCRWWVQDLLKVISYWLILKFDVFQVRCAAWARLRCLPACLPTLASQLVPFARAASKLLQCCHSLCPASHTLMHARASCAAGPHRRPGQPARRLLALRQRDCRRGEDGAGCCHV